jgi:Ecdysteroid kinase-like family
MSNVITQVSQISREWLADKLRENVTAFHINIETSTNANNARISVQTERGPKSLFLKMCRGQFGNPSEAHYCARDYADLPDAPIPTCYDAAYSAEQRAYHILMDDLTKTHRNSFEIAPTLAFGCAVAVGLAALHAHYWGEPRLAAIGEAIPTQAKLDEHLRHIYPGLMPMLAAVGDELDAKSQAAIPAIFERHPAQLLARTANPIGFTLVHGDVNPGNILSPRSQNFERERIYLIDRQPFDWSLTTWLGANDLSYMLVQWWPTELRRECEADVLRAYHAELVWRGMSNYSFDELWQDYRLCAPQNLFTCAHWCTDAEDIVKMRWVWLPKLQRVMAAYWDLRCDEL